VDAVSEMRNYDKWAQSLRNYEWLQGVVPGAMDVDVLIERRGKFLVLEAKPWQSGVSVGFGQHLALRALAEQEAFDVYLVGEVEGKDTLYIVRYDDRDPVMNRTRPVWFPPRRFQRTTKAGLALLVKGWFEEASAA
jgi:hypothetical protein